MLAASALVLTAVSASVPSASASSATCGSSIFDFTLDQKDTYDTSLFGVAAQIQRNTFDMCGPSGGSSDYVSTWTMLIPNHPRNQYAQAGWLKIGDNSSFSISGYHVFSEFSRACYPNCTGDDFVATYGPDPGGVKNYQVYLRASDDRIVMRADSTTLDVFNRDVTGEWSSDWSGQWASETHRVWSDVPGTASDKLRIYDIVKYDSGGGTSFIQNFSPPYANDPTHHDIARDDAAGGGKRIRIWTK